MLYLCVEVDNGNGKGMFVNDIIFLPNVIAELS